MQLSCHSDIYRKLNKAKIINISATGLYRLEIIKKYKSLRMHNYNESEALKFLGVKRSTFFNWQKKLKAQGTKALDNLSRRPKRVNKLKIPLSVKELVYTLRKQYPMWGKQKIAYLIRS
jgi:transposase